MKSKGISATPAAAALVAKPYPAGQQSPMDDFDAKQDMRTLVEANRIKSNKPRHAKAKAAAKAHLAHLSAVAKEPTIKGPPKGMTVGDGADGDMGAQD